MVYGKAKKHLESTKQKMSKSHQKSGNSKGSKNSQFGTMWITNGTDNQKIKKDEHIPDGWYKGRVLKSHGIEQHQRRL